LKFGGEVGFRDFGFIHCIISKKKISLKPTTKSFLKTFLLVWEVLVLTRKKKKKKSMWKTFQQPTIQWKTFQLKAYLRDGIFVDPI